MRPAADRGDALNAAGDGALVLRSMKDRVEKVFKVSGLSRIIPVGDAREAALAAA